LTAENTEGKMKKQWLVLVGAAVLSAAVASIPGFAKNGNGINVNGAHYNLNIIGVDNPKTAPLTFSDRHTIFVGLGGKDSTVQSKIYLTPGDFQVCDGNAFDAAYDCTGAQIQGQGAVFQLPCNTNVTADITCADGIASASYQVWGRALGQPGGSAVITTCATDATGIVVCSTDNTLDVFNRHPGKQTFTNVTQQLTTLTGCFFATPTATTLTCETVPLFSGGLVDFFWQYDNNGLRLAQLRFYLVQ
jgi:hypothetical protein